MAVVLSHRSTPTVMRWARSSRLCVCGLQTRYQASTSELYGLVEIPQREHSLLPRSLGWQSYMPTGSRWVQAYGMYACNGILFNHEVRRGNICNSQDYAWLAGSMQG